MQFVVISTHLYATIAGSIVWYIPRNRRQCRTEWRWNDQRSNWCFRCTKLLPIVLVRWKNSSNGRCSTLQGKFAPKSASKSVVVSISVIDQLKLINRFHQHCYHFILFDSNTANLNIHRLLPKS